MPDDGNAAAPSQVEVIRLRRQLDIAQEEIELRAAEAFQNGRAAVEAIDRIVAEKGIFEVCEMLENRGLLHYGVPFGMLRGYIADPASARNANLAIEQLKDAVRERAGIEDSLKTISGD